MEALPRYASLQQVECTISLDDHIGWPYSVTATLHPQVINAVQWIALN